MYGYKFIQVKSPDSDVFFILLNYATKMEIITLLFETCSGNKKTLVNASSMARIMSQQHATALLSFHAFSGCDTTSAFKGRGKLKPIKVLQKVLKYENALVQLGNEWTIPDCVLNEIEALTCQFYGRPRTQTVNQARYSKVGRLCKHR